MGVESQERKANVSPFPLGSSIIQDTADWVEEHLKSGSPTYVEACNSFWKGQDEILPIVRGLSHFRNYIYTQSAACDPGYERGFMLAMLTSRAKFEQIHLQFPPVTPVVMLNYFELMFSPSEYVDPILKEAKRKIGIKESERVNPEQLKTAMQHGRVPEDIRQELKKGFANETTFGYSQMRSMDSAFHLRLNTKTFFEALGPRESLAQGTLDGYMIARKAYELQKFDALWGEGIVFPEVEEDDSPPPPLVL